MAHGEDVGAALGQALSFSRVDIPDAYLDDIFGFYLAAGITDVDIENEEFSWLGRRGQRLCRYCLLDLRLDVGVERNRAIGVRF